MGEFVLEAEPLVDDLPVEIGALSLRLINYPAITAVMPCPADGDTLSVPVGGVTNSAFGPLVWAGQDLGFLFGAVPDIAELNFFDISDGWVFFALEGDGAEAVMARLVPIELRPSQTEAGRSFRTQLGHLQALIITSENGYDIGVMSSFAKTARDELVEAMRRCHAQQKSELG